MDEVTTNFHKTLRLTSEESASLAVNDAIHHDVDALHQCLLVQVLTRSRFNKCAFIDMMHSIWGNSCSIHFKEFHDTLFLCRFFNIANKERVIEGAPWHFERALVLTEEISEIIIPLSTSLYTALFWGPSS